DLARWVLSVDRRALVMKEVYQSTVVKPSEIAERSGRSVQNVSRAIHELEENGLIECLTPHKHTWKRYILTDKGKRVYEELMDSGLLGTDPLG
ncbi:MAG: MarR family transcriptional regulator, partial [Methanomassiliicoccales archaeon]|nr:MarR family transcriptional regulator [Methanomassiliicoccales archaeon]